MLTRAVILTIVLLATEFRTCRSLLSYPKSYHLDKFHPHIKLHFKFTMSLNEAGTHLDIKPTSFIKTVGTLSLISAPLGVLLDNQHGLFKVLNYNSMNMSIMIDGVYYLKSAYWVPILFSLAGLAMSAIVLYLDSMLSTSQDVKNPSFPKVLYGISLFSAQYYLSGALDYLNFDSLFINVVLSIVAVLGFYAFDKSVAGLILSIATALAGPIAEILLISGPLHLYSYTHADLSSGICSWIPAVYFLGGQAVGNLSRKIYYTYCVTMDQDEKTALDADS